MYFFLGRSPDNDIQLDEPSVSGRHCRISDDHPGFFVVEDLDSTNGTYINGTRIKTGKLTAQDKLSLSDVELDYDFVRHQILLIQNYNRSDFRADFAALQVTYDQHIDELTRIDFKKNIIISIINIVIIIAIGCININYFKGNSDADKYAQILTSVLLIFAYVTLQIRESYYDKEKDNLIKAFQESYRCPKCASSLKPIDYNSGIKGNICKVCRLKFK